MYDMEIEAIKQANRMAGKHFFDPDTMRFFRSRVLSGVIAGRYFITSEQFVAYYPEYRAEPRRYTIREAMPDGDIETVGNFQQYDTAAKARREAERLAQGDQRIVSILKNA